MDSKQAMLNIVKYTGGTILTVGISIFLYGFFISDYSAITGIGIGTIMGAIFIFLMGIFFVATEEMQEKRDKGIRVIQ
ncbi:hypothetical protein [Sporosarcina sp. FSL K6-3457]|uniref:hypothetical protein n=1 Tax=Sporosarcina sp. FSL K6-3457 TaxID=2978204 RepID=UPI0030F8069F